MVSALDIAAVMPPGNRPDSGGLVALLRDAVRRVDGVPFRTPPTVVWLARCFHGFSAVALVSQVLYDQCVPPAEECLPVAQECATAASELAEVIGDRLQAKSWFSEVVLEEMQADPKLAWIGPEVSGAVDQMLKLTERIRGVCEYIARDETALPEMRRAAAWGARSAQFAYWQYFV